MLFSRMASRTLSTGLRVVGSKPGILFTGVNSAVSTRVSVAYISGRSSRVEPMEKPKPWPYRSEYLTRCGFKLNA